MTTFIAGTQYGDYQGTIAADNADLSTLLFALRNKLSISEDQNIVGYQFNASYIGRSPEIDSIDVELFINNDSNLKDQIKSGAPIQVKKIKGSLSVNEFFSLFKRFEICLSTKGELNGATLEVIE